MTTTKPHPAYLKASRGEYVGYTDIATLIRTTLRAAFPNTKFSVRTDTYAGGGSVNIGWRGGPIRADVEKIASTYQTRGFDGTIDMAYSKSLWLYPDGTASLARCEGTQGSGGSHPEAIGSSLRPDGILCRDIASCFVFCSRQLTPELLEQAITQIKSENHSCLETVEWENIVVTDGEWGASSKGVPNVWFYDTWLDGAISRKAHQISLP